jgi:alkylation response protein AidB-like acyl-CoA dehydrogenase
VSHRARGGSDFFGATTVAEDKGDYFLVNGQKRLSSAGRGGLLPLYARTDPDAATPQQALSALIVDRGPGVETKYQYGLMGCRGGGTAVSSQGCEGSQRERGGEDPRAYDVFNTMMIPERLGTAVMTIGRPAPPWISPPATPPAGRPSGR